MIHAVISVRWKDDKKEYQRQYQNQLSKAQREEKAIRMKDWWKSDRGLYCSHKARASRYKIPFLLSFEDWLHIWTTSGHYHERSPTGYVMARKGDVGPYSVENVYITTAAQNKRDAWFNNRTRVPKHNLYYKDTQ